MLQQILSHAVGTAVALIPIVNPMAVAPAFLSLTASASRATRTRLAIRATVASTVILLVALFTGEAILSFFGISLAVLEVAGGLLVARAGWLMVTGNMGAVEEGDSSHDIALVPMALPLLAGPGAIGVTIALSVDHTGDGQYIGAVLGILFVGLVTLAFLHYAGAIAHRLGTRGIAALTTVMGFFVLALGVGLIAEGVIELVETRDPNSTIGPEVNAPGE